MKNKVLIFTLLITALFIFGCTSTDDEPILESVKQNEITNMEYSKMMDYMKDQYNSDNGALNKGKNNGNGVQWVLQYSGSPYYPGFTSSITIPNTNMVIYTAYPLEGDDVAKIQGEWMMTNWNLTEPRVFIADFSNGPPVVLFSNWCDEIRTGKSHQNSRVKFDTIDFDGIDGPDYYFYNPYDIDSDVLGTVDTTLTDAQNNEPGVWPEEGDCREPTKRVKVSYRVKIKNGVWTVDVTLDGKKYSWDKKLKNQS